MMYQAKIAAVTSSADTRESNECPGPSQSSGDMDESMQLTQPTEESYSETESSDEDPEVSTDWQKKGSSRSGLKDKGRASW